MPYVPPRDSYWKVLEANAAARRERAFAKWRNSGYADFKAYDEFSAMFCAANHWRAQGRRTHD